MWTLVFFFTWLLVTFGFACLGFIGMWLGLEVKEVRAKQKESYGDEYLKSGAEYQMYTEQEPEVDLVVVLQNTEEYEQEDFFKFFFLNWKRDRPDLK